MSMWHDLSVPQNNDRTFHLSLTVDGEPFDFTSYSLHLVVKASQTAADNTGTEYTLGTGLTAVSAKLGKVDWALPHTITATAGTQWWHIYALDGSSNRTDLMLGNLVVSAV